MSQAGVGYAGSGATLDQFGYGTYVQYGKGQSFVDANGDLWTVPYGTATPIKVGGVNFPGAMAPVTINSPAWGTQPGVPVSADPPSPAADPSSRIRALDMMQAAKKRKKLVRCEPDLLEAWND